MMDCKMQKKPIDERRAELRAMQESGRLEEIASYGEQLAARSGTNGPIGATAIELVLYFEYQHVASQPTKP